MRHEDENLAVLAEQLHRPRAMDAGVFHFVQQDHGRAANHRGVGDQQRPRLPAGEFGHAVVQIDRLAGQLVGEIDRFGHQVRRLAAGGRAIRECVSRNSRTGRSERNVVCCVISAIGFFAGL